LTALCEQISSGKVPFRNFVVRSRFFFGMGQHHSDLSPKALCELGSMSRFTQQEILHFFIEFSKQFPKGRVTQKDLKKIYKKAYPAGKPDELIADMFRVYDVDNSGTIDFREFLCGLCIMAHGTKDEKLKLAFDMYDADRSGWISREELVTLIKAIFKATSPKTYDPRMAEQTGDVMFEQLDQNQNNRVSLQEFINGCKNDPSIIGMIDTVEIVKP